MRLRHPRREAQHHSEGRLIRVTCGLTDTSVGTVADSSGFPDGGFAHHVAMPFGYHPAGFGEAMGGCFGRGTGGDRRGMA